MVESTDPAKRGSGGLNLGSA